MSQLKSREIQIAIRGMQTSFPASNTPPGYSDKFRNLYINTAGNAEVRQGLSSESVVPILSPVAQLHEFVDAKGDSKLFATAAGNVYVLINVWELRFSFPEPSSSSPIIYSYNMNDRIIFYDGVHRSIYTKDGVSFLEQRSVLEVGRATGGTGSNRLEDTTVATWITTGVAQYDLIAYSNISIGSTTLAYGLVTSVSADGLNHTSVSAGSGQGIGGTGSTEPQDTAPYQIIDMIELNIVPIPGLDSDNMGILASGSSTTSLRVSQIPDFTLTLVRTGDIVYNATRNKVTEVTAVTTAALGVAGITGQAADDEIVFLKSSMPIVRDAHVHFSRAYLVDAREPSKIRISGPNNSQDMGGSGAATLDVSTLQPEGEVIKALHSFQRFLVIGGSKNIYFYEGTVPSAGDGETADFAIRGSFPIGVLSKGSLSNVGNDCIFITNTGVQSCSLQKSSDQLVRAQASLQLDKTLRGLLKNLPEDEIQLIHYPRRSWMLIKAGTEMYVYNYSLASLGVAMDSASSSESSTAQTDPRLIAWHLFDGPLAQQRCFLVRTNGDLLTGSVQGQVNIFDQNVYTDLSANIEFEYTTAWDNFQGERGLLPKVSRKQGKSIIPYLESGAIIPVTVMAEAGFAKESSDTVVVTADSGNGVIGYSPIGQFSVGGPDVSDKKYPLRWNGSEVKLHFTGEVSAGPFQLTGCVVYYTTGDGV